MFTFDEMNTYKIQQKIKCHEIEIMKIDIYSEDSDKMFAELLDKLSENRPKDYRKIAEEVMLSCLNPLKSLKASQIFDLIDFKSDKNVGKQIFELYFNKVKLNYYFKNGALLYEYADQIDELSTEVERLNHPKRKIGAKRILSEVKEVQNSLPSNWKIEVYDLYNIHITMKCINSDSPAFNTYLHAQVIFTDEYPTNPPKTICLNSYPHGHIFGQYICLDMLENPGGGHIPKSKGTGWTPAYSLLMTLKQLEIFVFSFIDSYIPSETRLSQKLKCTCHKCGDIIISPNKEIISSDSTFKFEKLPEEIILEILSFADMTEKVLGIPNYYIIYKCFFTNYNFEKSVLCFGVSVQKDNCSIDGLDLISSHAFDDCEHHKDSWGNEFNEIIPIFINQDHFQRGQSVLERLTKKFCGKTDGYSICLMIGKLLNGLLVSMMNKGTYASNKLLFIYYQLKILLSKVADEKVKIKVKKQISDFLVDPTTRTKSKIPNLGEFFILVSLFEDLSWDDVKYPIMEETMNRMALWIHKAHAAAKVKKYDIGISFKASIVGFQLLILLGEFLDNPRWSLKNITLQHGIPQEKDLDLLQQKLKDILNIKTYAEISKNLKVLPFGNDSNIKKFLWMHEQNSFHLGYHGKK